MKENYLIKYRQLPEARMAVPDIIRECQDLQNKIDECTILLENYKNQLSFKKDKSVQYLKKYWTEEELKKAGF